MLCTRGYRPIEISNVLYRHVDKPTAEDDRKINVRVIGPEESQLFASISAKGWSHEHPVRLGFLLQIGVIATAREGNLCFIGEVDGIPGAAGVLCMQDG